MKRKINILFTLCFIVLCVSGWTSSSKPVAQKGEMALEQWDFFKKGTVSLEGQWNFYWKVNHPNELSNPSFIDVPSVWDHQNRYPSSGYGLYHLKVSGLEVGKSYGLKIPIMSNAYRFWIDNRLMISNGTPGKTKQTTIPFYKPQEVFFEAKKSTVHLYVAISNFHYRSGGMWYSLELGTPEQITSLSKKKLIFEAILFGSLVLSGLYHIVLYVHRKKERILLLFGIACLVISARILVIGEQMIMEFFRGIPWELIVKTEFLTFYTVVPLFSWFMYSLYKQEVAITFCKLITAISLLFSLLVVLTPAVIYTKSLFLYQTITIIAIVYIISSLIIATYRKREGARVVLTCAAFYAVTVINDILYNNGIIDSINLSSLGLFVFIFSQSSIIAKRVSSAFQKVEEYSLELAELNHTLEEKIYERTKSLEESKQELQRVNEALTEMSYQDPLTNLPNRRYFDDLYEKEWENALNNQMMISILFFDIDHFKAYNDCYGHQQGDTTLRKVAGCLQETIQKYSGTVARIGGEEFIAIISKMDPEQINRIAEECRINVKKLKIFHKDSNASSFVTISVGVATIVPNSTFPKRKLIRTADEALYYAKEEGRNQVVLSSSI